MAVRNKRHYPIEGLRLAIRKLGSPMKVAQTFDLPLQSLLDVLELRSPMPEQLLKAFETYSICEGISAKEFKALVNAAMQDPKKQWRIRVHHSMMRLVQTVDGKHYLMQRDRIPPKGARFPVKFAGRPVYHEGRLRFQLRDLPILPLFVGEQ
ncbi:hypothetical protein [Shewanella algae]|uniref:hypothetical protein n=1 Tax=Shewanella algae TaxID=38313 RepID=UPI0031F5A407